MRSTRRKGTTSSGHDYQKMTDKSWGYKNVLLNRRKDDYTSDYLWVYKPNDDDDELSTDIEIGINKDYYHCHDIDYFDGEKNEAHRFIRRVLDEHLMDSILDEEFFEENQLNNFLIGEEDDV